MVSSITRDGKTVYFHTAWADDTRGTNFSLNAYDGANYIGSLVNSSSTEVTDYVRYTWHLIGVDEADEDPLEGDLERRISELENSDAFALAKETSGSVTDTVTAMNEGLGNLNILSDTNQGVLGWTGSSNLVLTAVQECIYNVLDDPVNHLRVTASSAGGYLYFNDSYLREVLGADDPEENTYTLSADIKMSDLITIPVSVQNIDETDQQIDFGDIDLSTDNEEFDATGTWMPVSLTAQCLGVAADAQVLYFDLSDMPTGSVLDIANLKVEYGAAATEWRMSQEEIAGEASEAKRLAHKTNQYFWHTETGTDTGAHITEIPREDFIADPANGGGNLLARSNGIAVRDGLTELATFGADGARIGKETDSHLVISDESLQLTDEYGNNWLSVNAEVDVSTGSPASFTTHGDGTTTVFGLSFVIANVVSVAIDGVLQTEGTDFERVNNAIKFIVPPSNGSIIIIQYRPPGGSSNINYTFGERDESKSYGLYSVAEGVLTTASGWASHAEGHESIATGRASHAENSGVAEGERSHAEGYSRASGECSHAEGGTYDNTSFPTIASGDSSHAEGFETQATGDMAHAQNFGTLAYRRSQTAIGEYNVADYTGDHASRGKYALIIGNGTENTRSNALTVDWSGNLEASGEIIDGHGNKLSDAFGGLIDLIYPVGSYYETTDTTFDPNTAWGGTWSLEAEGQVHVSAGATYTAGDTGGSENETLTEAKLPLITGQAKLASNIARNTTGANTLLESASGHFSRVSQTGQNILRATNTSVSQNQTLYTSVKYEFGQSSPTPVSHMQPYVVVNRWHRTA